MMLRCGRRPRAINPGGPGRKIKLWPKEGEGAAVVLIHGGAVNSLAVLPDGRLASGGADGKIKLWPKDGTGEPVVLTHGNMVFSLAVLTDGRLATGGEDGKIKLWLRRETETYRLPLSSRWPQSHKGRVGAGPAISAPTPCGSRAAAADRRTGGPRINRRPGQDVGRCSPIAVVGEERSLRLDDHSWRISFGCRRQLLLGAPAQLSLSVV